ncbi:hypothetical protein I552_7496 [Mycobacterium xenopi 3993]|nr:hypothetical protein I552_7496 [Mycobacterium xenopi 3993]
MTPARTTPATGHRAGTVRCGRAMAAWFGSFRYTRPVRHHRTTGSQSAPTPWYRKRAVLVGWGALVLLLIALIVYGLVELATGGGGRGVPSTTSSTTTTTTTTTTTAPTTTTTTTESSAPPPPAGGATEPPQQAPQRPHSSHRGGRTCPADPEAAAAVSDHDPTGADGHNVAAHPGGNGDVGMTPTVKRPSPRRPPILCRASGVLLVNAVQ